MKHSKQVLHHCASQFRYIALVATLAVQSVVSGKTRPGGGYSRTPANGAEQAQAFNGIPSPAAVQAETFDVLNQATEIVYSPNDVAFAATVPIGSRSGVCFNGKTGNKFDEIGTFQFQGQTFGHLGGNRVANVVQSFLFSADGKHMAYLARRGQHSFIVVDDQENPIANFYAVREANFSPDSAHFAFLTTDNRSPRTVVLDGKEVGEYFGCSDLTFSANSKHFAYLVNGTGPSDSANLPPTYAKVTLKNGVAVYDNQPGPAFEKVSQLQLSADGEHYLYVGTGLLKPGETPNSAAVDQQSHLMVDGKELAVVDQLSNVEFSPDGHHVMFVATNFAPAQPGVSERPIKEMLVGLDGQKWPCTVYLDGKFKPILSPDGMRVAFVEFANKDVMGHSHVVTVNGKQGMEYPEINSLVFSPDGKHLVYHATTLVGADKKNHFIVYDDNEQGPFVVTSNAGEHQFALAFSPDSKHFAFVAPDGDSIAMAADGKAGDKFEMILSDPVFSADGQHLAFIAAKDPMRGMAPMERVDYKRAHPHDSGFFCVVDGQAQPIPAAPNFGKLDALCFSPDGKHVALAAGTVLVDGQTVPLEKNCNEISHLQFTPDSNHIFCQMRKAGLPSNADLVLAVDGLIVPGYTMTTAPKVQPDGKITCFAVDVTKQLLAHITVTPAAPSNFGIGAATTVAQTPSDTSPAQPAQPSNPPVQPDSTPPRPVPGYMPPRIPIIPKPRHGLFPF